MRAAELADRVRVAYPDVVVARGEVTVIVDRSDLLDALAALRDEPALGLDFLSSVTATDWPGRSPRFWVAYELYSMTHGHRLRLKVGLEEDDPRIPSVTPLHPTADWHERETYDLAGVQFVGHPNLRRILCVEDWVGHPLRKDYEMPLEYHGIRGK